MAITSWPFDGQTVTETQFSQWANMLHRSGVDTGAFLVSPGAGMQLNVAAGLGLVRGHAISSTATEPITLDAAEASARVDRIVLKLDPSTNTIVIAKKKGTAGSPTPPALTQTTAGIYEELLADIAVGAGVSVINAGNITDRRTSLTDVTTTAASISDATPLGRSILTAANRAAVLTALGFSAPVVALLNATTAIEMREAMRFFKNGATFTPTADDLKYTDL